MTRARRESPEFSSLASCCRWNFATADRDAQLEISRRMDWIRFLDLSRFHRVQGLVWNALAPQADSVPDNVKETLASDARSIAATNLAIARECLEFQEAFGRSGIPLLFIKGLTVAALAYRSPLLKMGWDIDLLIHPTDLPRAAEILTGRGYSLRLPNDIKRLRSWHARSKESVWSRDGSLHVELHTRLADNRLLIPGLDVHSPRQLVEIVQGIALPTLAEDELFAYLAVHGASSAWFRLKWISDFAALLHGRNAENIRRLYDRSQQLGAGRAAGQALLLADALFDTLEPIPALRDELASDRMARLLCWAALQMLTKRTRDPTEQPLGTLTIHWTQFLLQPGPGYKWSELWRQAESVLKRGEG